MKKLIKIKEKNNNRSIKTTRPNRNQENLQWGLNGFGGVRGTGL